MLREFAVDPAVVAAWSGSREGWYFLREFGIGSPRIISRYPKKWKWLARQAWEAAGGNRAGKRIEELLERLLGDILVHRRGSTWNPDMDWRSNAVREHRRLPFHAILSRSNPTDHPNVLVANDVHEDPPLWNLPRGLTVPRTAKAMAGALRGMLLLATDIVLVDPYFVPDEQRFVRVLSECLAACRAPERSPGRPPGVLYVTSAGRDRAPAWEHFRTECGRRLPRQVPAGQRVTIRRVTERPGEEELHDRFVLTEHGGVSVPRGLDQSRDGTGTVDLHLLTRAQHELRWRQYAGASPGFASEQEVTVEGRNHRQ